MTIGTSLGGYYDDEHHYAASQWDSKYDDNIIDPETTPDIGTRDQNIQSPSNTPQTNRLYVSPIAQKTEDRGMTDQYNTKLSPEDEVKFQAWAGDNPRLGSTYDYDSRGFWQNGAGTADNGHGGDEWKKPNHPTFSDQSIYHGQDGYQGGTWGNDNGKVTFTPSETNIKNLGQEGLQDYFKRVEPDSDLRMPPPGASLKDINDIPHHDWVEKAISDSYHGLKNAIQLPGEVAAGNVDLSSQAGIQTVADAAKSLVMGPQGSLMKPGEGTLGSFGGVRSKLMDPAALKTARELESSGAPVDEIFNKTGLFRGAENLWRHEIDDSKSRYNDLWTLTAKRETETPLNPKDPFSQVPFNEFNGMLSTKLPDALTHSELYKAYPQLKDIKLVYNPRQAGAYWDENANAIVLGSANNHSAVLHEVQHAIQSIEGFAKGGAIDKDLKYGTPAHSKAKAFYERIAGEVESRNTETRMILNKDERRRISPLDTQDEPFDNQFVLNQSYGATHDFDKYYTPPPKKK